MDTVEDPFPMDEELGGAMTKSPTPAEKKTVVFHKHVTPRYTEPAMMGDRNMIHADAAFLRSRLDAIKLEEGAGTTTEEDDVIYEEDADDKLDKTATAKMEEQYYCLENAADQPLTPPENFAPVINQIYRSSFPQPPSFAFLKKLKLKSVLCLIPEEYPKSHEEFFKREGIQLFQLGMSGNKEPFVIISSDLITEAAKIVLNPENQPILIHCNRGKHRTGCLVGVLRRLQRWSLTSIFDEYRKFAAPKERPMDQQFIELYDETDLVKYAEQNNLIPLKWD